MCDSRQDAAEAGAGLGPCAGWPATVRCPRKGTCEAAPWLGASLRLSSRTLRLPTCPRPTRPAPPRRTSLLGRSASSTAHMSSPSSAPSSPGTILNSGQSMDTCCAAACGGALSTPSSPQPAAAADSCEAEEAGGAWGSCGAGRGRAGRGGARQVCGQ